MITAAHCPHCGDPWTDHGGVEEPVCRQVCEAKIRPFPTPVELTCERADGPHDAHGALLRDYAYPGSETVINWQESDRRTFRGLYIPCGDNDFPCVLPNNHRGRHQHGNH